MIAGGHPFEHVALAFGHFAMMTGEHAAQGDIMFLKSILAETARDLKIYVGIDRDDEPAHASEANPTAKDDWFSLAVTARQAHQHSLDSKPEQQTYDISYEEDIAAPVEEVAPEPGPRNITSDETCGEGRMRDLVARLVAITGVAGFYALSIGTIVGWAWVDVGGHPSSEASRCSYLGYLGHLRSWLPC